MVTKRILYNLSPHGQPSILFWEDAEAFPGQRRDKISSACPVSVGRLPPGCPCLINALLRRHLRLPDVENILLLIRRSSGSRIPKGDLGMKRAPF